jgi:hypothetical protein
MRILHLLLPALLLAVCISCGGGSGFQPSTGTFTGQFLVGTLAIGTFTVNVNGSSFGGGGVLVHNTFNVPVAISSVISDDDISGRVENASLGHGSFAGYFIGNDHAQGDFTYADDGGISLTTGTWTADRD